MALNHKDYSYVYLSFNKNSSWETYFFLLLTVFCLTKFGNNVHFYDAGPSYCIKLSSKKSKPYA